MKNRVLLGASLLILASGFQAVQAQDKAAARTLKVNVHYTGSGTVDEKHKIQVFMFDSPDFMQGNAMPTGMQMTESKTGTVTFTDIAAAKVYVVGVYDPTGGYDGQSGPPPSGSSMGMYSKQPGTPEAIAIDAGKTIEIDLNFDDMAKMP